MPRGCNPSSRPSSAPVMRRWPSSVNTPNSTAVRRTLEDQKAKAVCRIWLGSSCGFVLDMNHFTGDTSPGQCPGFIRPSTMEALKARLISQAPRIFALSLPDVPLVEGHVIFPQQLAVFLLERFCFVMRLLVFDVTHKIVKLTVADRKISITSLPKE